MATVRLCIHVKKQVILQSQEEDRPVGEYTGFSCTSTYCLADMARWVRETSDSEPLIEPYREGPTHQGEARAHT